MPWGHNTRLLDAVADPERRLWYAQSAVENGWSRSVLAFQIETRPRERQGAAVANFDRTLPAPRSDLARRMIKAPYVPDFLTIAPKAHERHLEAGLVEHLKKTSWSNPAWAAPSSAAGTASSFAGTS